MKINHYNIIIFISYILSFASCSQTSETPNVTSPLSGEWLIPTSSVFDGGPGKDGIPSIDNPIFETINDVTYMDDSDLVLAIKSGNEIKAYTHPVMDWHEIVNDEIGGTKFALTYCPLTGTGIGWNRVINGSETTFGVSGKLYNTNLMPFDRMTESYWSQMRLDCVNGDLINEEAQNIMFFETSWKTWKTLYPDAPIISTSTGFNRTYGQYPYGDYITNNNFLIFPVEHENDALPQKERVLSILSSSSTKVFTFDSFSQSKINMVTDSIEGQNIMVVGSKEDNYMTAFINETDHTFEIIENKYPVVLRDNEGTEWDVFGTGISGPREGEKLEQPVSMMAYWFAIVAFYPDVSIY